MDGQLRAGSGDGSVVKIRRVVTGAGVKRREFVEATATISKKLAWGGLFFRGAPRSFADFALKLVGQGRNGFCACGSRAD